ncbi:heavy metal translocating P-type ATPase [Methanogenium organophilum]|uniref:Heavy metal translocating P-type ATPase n=1 Tax=Methanogenium organophilum TaxID=2199 RepID=A0A9X9T8D3_METOG|nr:heavy metal translocating P-type ATPase [Methanogenium organophilum]WAI01585.1 heavy metal translocating P-type ATPase [Methanogenium organophilum]
MNRDDPTTKEATAVIRVTGMHCATCVATVEKALSAVDGVHEVSVSLASEKAVVQYDPNQCSVQDLDAAITSAGYGVLRDTLQIRLGGIHCATCVVTVEKALMSLEGVYFAEVNLTTNRAVVGYDPDMANIPQMKRVIEDAGYEYLGFVGDEEGNQEEIQRSREIRNLRNRTLIGFTISFFLLAIMLSGVMLPIPMTYFMFVISTPFFIYLAYPIFRAAWGALRNYALTMDVMYAMGIGVAYGSSVLGTFGIVLTSDFLFYETAIMLSAFLTLGRYLEARAKGRTTDAIRKLVELQAKTAIVIRENKEFEVPVEELTTGNIILVKPGGKIPVDGEIVTGESYIDESMISGEPVPVHKKPGSLVTGGTINTTGSITFTAIRVGKETYLAQIIRLVETAQATKPSVQKFADIAVTWFIPTVLMIAIAAALFWYFVLGATGLFSLTILISILVIACPCALGLATPTAITVGVGRGAELGILIKNSEVLELSRRIDTIIFDKTGTLTRGIPVVTETVLFGQSEEDFLAIASGVEARSEHPLAAAVVAHAEGKEIVPADCTEFQAVSGKGVKAEAGGHSVLVGSRTFLSEQGIGLILPVTDAFEAIQNRGETAIGVAADDAIAGIIGISDSIRDTSFAAAKELHTMGLAVGMVTGDNERTAAAVAQQLGTDFMNAEVLPDEKSGIIQRMQKEGKCIAFVGDGINDAPALAAADIGIAIGSGTDIAIESGDIVLVQSDPLDVAAAIQLGRKVMGRIKLNLFWAFAYNAALIPVAAGVLYPLYGITFRPEFAGFAMALSSVTVISLSLLLKRYTPPATVLKTDRRNIP